jgi:hypothetical protein
VNISFPTDPHTHTWLVPDQGRTFSGLVDLVGLAGLVWDGSGGGRTYRRLAADEMRGTMTHAWEQALQVPACFFLPRRVYEPCCGSGMFIPDPNFFLSWIRIFSIPDPHQKNFKLS